MSHVLFPNHPRLAEAWDWADGPDSAHRLSSLLFLAANTKLLPGAVFFTVPDDAWGDEKWRELIGKSQPYCHCASRRVLWPTQGRSRLITRKPPKTVELMTVEGSAGFDPRQQLIIAPHGGDLASAYAAFSFRTGAGEPRVDQLPFMADNRAWQRLVYNQAGVGYANDRLHTWQPRGNRLEWWVEDFGELEFFFTFQVNEWRRQWLPMCSVTATGYAPYNGSLGWRPWTMTFQIDASVCVRPYEQTDLHVCVGDATPKPF